MVRGSLIDGNRIQQIYNKTVLPVVKWHDAGFVYRYNSSIYMCFHVKLYDPAFV